MYLAGNLEAAKAVVRIYNKLTFIQRMYFVPLENVVPCDRCANERTCFIALKAKISLAWREKEKKYRDAYVPTNVPACYYCVMLFNVHEKRTLAATSELISIMKRNSKRNVCKELIKNMNS